MPSSPLLSAHSSPSPPSPAGSASSSSRGDSNDSSFSFDMSLDPSDPLNFLMYPDSNSHEDSLSHPMWPDQPSTYANLNEDDLSIRNNFNPNIPQFKLDDSFMNVNSDMNMSLGMNMGSDMDFNFQPSIAHMPSIDDFDSNIFNQAMLSLGLDMSQLPTATASSNDYLSAPNQLSFQNLNQDGYAFSSPSQSLKSSGRRLSVTSSSSSSNASLSPTVEHANTPSPSPSISMSKFDISTYEFSNIEKMVHELAQRARERAGVTSALPISSADAEVFQQQAAKVAIPRLTRPTPSPPASSPAAKNKAQPLPPSPSDSDTVATSSKEPLSFAESRSPAISTSSTTDSPPPQQAPPHKPKTSHTTIERRYRTNLNARIQALRNAVPALRVLEQRDGNRVGNLGIKIPDGQEEADVIDARGYVDGVKVARKGSKANVLGKAVEYIRVLKRRELRLKKEQMGLKILLCTLIGGSELLKEWEKEWANKYGGPERDEIDTDGEDGEGDSEDEDDGDDDDKEREDSVGKKRKRVKVDEKVNKATPVANVLVITEKKKVEAGEPKEKRKRGRPRKNAATPTSSADVSVDSVVYGQQQDEDIKMVDVNTAETQTQQYVQREIVLEQAQSQAQPQQGQGQYLLAAFAFFSFFNSPGSVIPRYYNANNDEQYHTHTGSVLTHNNPSLVAAQISSNGELSFTWRDAMHVIHLVVSALLFLSIVLPWLPRTIRRRVAEIVPASLGPLFGFSSSMTKDASSDASVTKSKKRITSTRRAELISALHQRTSNLGEEFECLRLAMNVHSHWWSIFTTIPRVYGRIGSRAIVKGKSGNGVDGASIDGLELSMLEQKAWMRLAEIAAFNGTSAPLTTRLKIYISASKYLPSQSATLAADLATLALVIKPFRSSKAEALWTLARNNTDKSAKILGSSAVSSGRMCKPYEAYVLEKLDVDVAMERLTMANVDVVGLNAPLGVLAAQLIRDSVRKRAERIFIREVLGEEEEEIAVEKFEDDIRRVIEVGRCLDKRTTELVNILESVQSNICSRFTLDEIASSPTTSDTNDEDSGIFSLLHAIILYRRAFPSASVSPLSSTVISPRNSKHVSDTQPVLSTSISAIPSPPPSPCRKNAALHLALRRALDSSAFDRGDTLEDARDCVVDLLTTS